ncbi:MAG TPA: hypothetical protein VD866_01955 [Urbifossiella sp.]|nr:hypothetical protein [Urbifossiella sp.]
MSQHDMTIANQNFPTVRADLNSAFQALASTSLGASRPPTAYAGQLWIDNNTPGAAVWSLFVYDGTDDILLGHIDVTNNRFGVATSQAADVPSAATVDLDAAYGMVVDVTGTTGISAVTLSQGRVKVVRFTGALTLTHGASLVLPGGANITTAAGDYAILVGYASSVVRCAGYISGGLPLVAATQAQMEATSSLAAVVTPGRQQYHPSAAKFWVKHDDGTTIAASYNVSSVTDNGTGDHTVNFATAFSSTDYCVVATSTNQTYSSQDGAGMAAGSIRIQARDSAGTLADAIRYFVAGFGDQ